MSRLSNLSTLKLGIFKSWNTYWFDRTYYSNILFNDLKLRDYLTGIFYKLKIVSDYYYFYRFFNDSSIISINLIFFSSLRFKSVTLRHVYKLGLDYIFFYRKRHWKSFLYYTKLIRHFTSRIPKLKSDISFSSSFFSFNYTLTYFLSLSKLSFFYFNNQKKILSSKGFNKIHNGLQTVVNFENSKNWLNYKVFTRWICTSLRSLNQVSTIMWYWSLKNFFSSQMMHLVELSKYFFYISLFNSSNLDSHRVSFLLALVNEILFIASYKMIYISHHVTLNQIETKIIPAIIDRRAITKSLFVNFRNQIERTISIFEQTKVYFNFSIFFKKNPFIISAKLITETLVYLLQSGKKIVPSFFFIRNWQASLYKNKRVLEHTYFQSARKVINLNYLFYYASKRFPLIGIRIECSGTHKKGRMARIYFYSSWVKDSLLTGRMPNSTMIADIDYYQYFAITKSSSIGIKTWIFLETHLYNNNNKYISIVY